MRRLILSAMLAAVAMPTTPAMARQGHDERSSQDGQRDGGKGQNQNRNGNRQSDQQSGQHGNRQGTHQDNRHGDQHDNRWKMRQVDNRNYRRHAYNHQHQITWQDYNRYDYNRPDPRYGTYYADRYYRDGSYYQPYTMSRNDRIYRGSNNRYYCRRNDGTTGLIIGAIGGGLLGDAIAPRGSKTIGAILGGTAGALIGRSIGRDGVRCQ